MFKSMAWSFNCSLKKCENGLCVCMKKKACSCWSGEKITFECSIHQFYMLYAGVNIQCYQCGIKVKEWLVDIIFSIFPTQIFHPSWQRVVHPSSLYQLGWFVPINKCWVIDAWEALVEAKWMLMLIKGPTGPLKLDGNDVKAKNLHRQRKCKMHWESQLPI